MREEKCGKEERGTKGRSVMEKNEGAKMRE